ncbi:MAG: YbaB/EbfC family nucleoid-associated protein [Alphaproteobacteria bacterium]
MVDFNDMMSMAQSMQSKMSSMQEDLLALEVEGKAGAGMVTVTVNGRGFVKAVSIDQSLFADGADDKTVVEDLIAAALNDAIANLETQKQEKMGELTGGLGLPPDIMKAFI